MIERMKHWFSKPFTCRLFYCFGAKMFNYEMGNSNVRLQLLESQPINITNSNRASDVHWQVSNFLPSNLKYPNSTN